jgi:alpha-tubulin suppressor-like RCC1 family protein
MLPRAIAGLQHVWMMACGANHTVALTRDGGVYSWGDGAAGQLGHPEYPTESQSTPTRVQFFDAANACAAFASAGVVHTAVQTTDGSVYMFGDGRYGKLGGGAGRKMALLPQKLRGFESLL